MLLDGWEEVTNTVKFLTGPAKDLSRKQKDLLTPVILNPQALTDLRSTYQISIRQVGYQYSAPIFRFASTIVYKHTTFLITNKYHLEEYEKWLKFNFSIQLKPVEIPVLKHADTLVSKYIRFRKEPDCEKARMYHVSTKGDDGNFYCYKILDEAYPYRDIIL